MVTPISMFKAADQILSLPQVKFFNDRALLIVAAVMSMTHQRIRGIVVEEIVWRA